MNIKSMLLGTAAGLMAVSAANAADLPGEAVPAAVDYVKVCDAFGKGFFYIPGTETCLDISGRVRFRVTYTDADPGDSDIAFRADGRVDFDARTATEYGTLRSFFRIADNGAARDTVVDAAFIQLGYLTVGYNGDLANGDVLYGINGAAFVRGDQDRLQVTVFADDLGGGFYAGASISAQTNGVLRSSMDDEGEAQFEARLGIADQSWGGIDLSGVYSPVAGGSDAYAIKATADLTLTDEFGARLVAAYSKNYADALTGGDDTITLAAAASYTMGAAKLYAGIAYDIEDVIDDQYFINAGVDYTVTSGLVLTGEVNYRDRGAVEDWAGIVQLSRTW